MALLSVMGMYQYDDTLFDTMQLPEGIDKNTLVGNILAECSEMELLISNPETLKEILAFWSAKNVANWQKIYDAMTAYYNPLWNKDGTVTETENRNLRSTGSSTGQVSAFNTENFRNQSKQDASGTDTGSITRSRTESGNIGVTTSQQMLKEEIEIRRDYNVYDIITEDFKSRFCLMVY